MHVHIINIVCIISSLARAAPEASRGTWCRPGSVLYFVFGICIYIYIYIYLFYTHTYILSVSI